MAATIAAAAAIHQVVPPPPPVSGDAVRAAGVDAVGGAADDAVAGCDGVDAAELELAAVFVIALGVTGGPGWANDLVREALGAGTLGVIAKCVLACRTPDPLSSCSA